MDIIDEKRNHPPFGKRLFDVTMSIIVLILTTPIMLFAALLIWVSYGRPILFAQPRPGLKGKIFTLYKFRTMTESVDALGKPLADTVRITKLGNFLRTTSIDELPELVNVLRGEMSLVGPRPLLVEYLPRYNIEQARRHEVLPGITGWAQVNGRNALSWDEKFKLDVWYVDNWSFWLDIKIIWMTLWEVIQRRNVTPPGQVSMPEFRGSLDDHSDVHIV